MVDQEKEKGIENKSKKKGKEMEEQNKTMHRWWTRTHMKTRIRIDKSGILKMTEKMDDGQVSKVDFIKVQRGNNFFMYESYMYLNWNDFEALFG